MSFVPILMWSNWASKFSNQYLANGAIFKAFWYYQNLLENSPILLFKIVWTKTKNLMTLKRLQYLLARSIKQKFPVNVIIRLTTQYNINFRKSLLLCFILFVNLKLDQIGWRTISWNLEQFGVKPLVFYALSFTKEDDK